VRSTFLKIEDITLDALAKLSYLNAVLQEGLRMYPPAPIALPRLVPKEGLEVEGRFVPSGVTVGVHHMATYRLPRHFKNPDEFHPERWLGDPEYKDDHLDAWEVCCAFVVRLIDTDGVPAVQRWPAKLHRKGSPERMVR
jgi:cytochrome P450